MVSDAASGEAISLPGLNDTGGFSGSGGGESGPNRGGDMTWREYESESGARLWRANGAPDAWHWPQHFVRQRQAHAQSQNPFSS